MNASRNSAGFSAYLGDALFFLKVLGGSAFAAWVILELAGVKLI